MMIFVMCGFCFLGSPHKQIGEIVSAMQNISVGIYVWCLIKGKNFSLEQKTFSSPSNSNARPLLHMIGELC